MNERIILAENGQSNWRIVRPSACGFLTSYAAEELQKYIRECCGAELNIVDETEPPRLFEIALSGARPLPDGAHALSGGAQDEDFVITASASRIDICGSGLRGTLYGVYEFMERCMGVRFFTKERTYVPRRTMLAIAPFSDYQKPAINFRMEPFKCARDAEFLLHSRINMGNEAAFADYAPEFRQSGVSLPYSYGHSIADIVPDELFDAHPEYFPLMDGARQTGPHYQRCLTNPDVLAMAIDWAKAKFRADPMRRLIAIGQNDTYPDRPNNCRCPACAALDEAEGTPMGSLLAFVNRVAEAIEPEFPDAVVTTLAYRYTRRPPKTIKPRHNVAIVLCSIECCFSHPMDSGCGADYYDGPIGHVSNAEFVGDIEAWSAIAQKLIIWDYVTDFLYYVAPYPNLDVLAPNMRFFERHNAVGVYPEGAHDHTGVEFDELRTYMLSRLMWDAQSDSDGDMLEFLAGTLGAAAAPVYKYIRLLHDHVTRNNIHMSTYNVPDERMFPRELVDKALRLMERAEALAIDDMALRAVRRIAMNVRFVELILYKRDLPAAEQSALIDDFLNEMDELGITGLCEQGRPELMRDYITGILVGGGPTT